MNNPFLSNTNYEIVTGVHFPYTDVLGIIVYPVNGYKTLLYLKEIDLIRSIKFMASRACLTFCDETNRVIVRAITPKFQEIINISANDFKIDFTDPITYQGCGCMVVKKEFALWLTTLPYTININDTKTLYINPTYIYTTLSNSPNYINVNNQPVNNIIFKNVSLYDNKFIITDKPKSEETSTSDKYMKALRLQNSQCNVLLKGRHIGFTISPPSVPESSSTEGSSGSDTEDAHKEEPMCRVHIKTENGKITFIDQSKDI